MQMFKLLRRQVARARTGTNGEVETVVYEDTYVPDPNGTIVLLNAEDANKVYLTRSETRTERGKLRSSPVKR